jgi:hypothetical protein
MWEKGASLFRFLVKDQERSLELIKEEKIFYRFSTDAALYLQLFNHSNSEKYFLSSQRTKFTAAS